MLSDEDSKPLASYLASRLLVFSKRYSDILKKHSEIILARDKGIVSIEGLIFSIKTDKRNLEVSVKTSEENWERLLKHFNRINEPGFWTSDNYLFDIKRKINQYSDFLVNRKFYSREESNELLFRGVFDSNNKDSSFYSFLNCVVRPLLFYKDFL
jgi:hypothetical protein